MFDIGGALLLYLNALEIPEQSRRELLAIETPELVIEQRLPNPPTFGELSIYNALVLYIKIKF